MVGFGALVWFWPANQVVIQAFQIVAIGRFERLEEFPMHVGVTFNDKYFPCPGLNPAFILPVVRGGENPAHAQKVRFGQ